MRQVLHGWGQHVAFEGELRAYVAAVGHEPAIVSDYMDLLLVDGPTPEWEEACGWVFEYTTSCRRHHAASLP